MPRKLLLSFTLCGLVWVTIQPVSLAQDATPKATLVGSWEFTAKPDPSHSAATLLAALATFTSDGTVIETDTRESALHITPGHGIWQPSPAIGNWFIRFTSLVANSDGTLHSKRIVTITGELNSMGDQFSGQYSIEIVDPSGRVMITGSGTVAGQLMVHPLLP
jgi:hypothetical protein